MFRNAIPGQDRAANQRKSFFCCRRRLKIILIIIFDVIFVKPKVAHVALEGRHDPHVKRLTNGGRCRWERANMTSHVVHGFVGRLADMWFKIVHHVNRRAINVLTKNIAKKWPSGNVGSSFMSILPPGLPRMMNKIGSFFPSPRIVRTAVMR
ncbi:hypothetical protein Ae201684P_012777 [Aphanomyces euteiches]|uniref:Uncharacterized protein n=1 Tax=Aphanomyces euteiches TaxID=100861 RepID=A0A6G0WZ13_9STRA|nr:hypothetical protein Ae201684_010095 [Aphanomyces euteiches]KAH9076291.1 hypothetical protein Ae201684P_012777 [Aphanomyces euteiches]